MRKIPAATDGFPRERPSSERPWKGVLWVGRHYSSVVKSICAEPPRAVIICTPMPNPSSALPSRSHFIGRGRAQLSLVEHALCPLDSAASLRPGGVHTVRCDFWDAHHNRRTATAMVACPSAFQPTTDYTSTACLRPAAAVHRFLRHAALLSPSSRYRRSAGGTGKTRSSGPPSGGWQVSSTRTTTSTTRSAANTATCPLAS